MAFKFDLKGADKVLRNLDKLPKKLAVRVDETLKYNVAGINAEQVQRAPIDTGRLRGSIAFYKVKEMDYILQAGVEYAPYVEFGTGAMVDVPAGLESYAMQFKGSGEVQVNIPARPYFFPPFISARKQIVNDIKKALGKL
jgi:phage gpG-like protein